MKNLNHTIAETTVKRGERQCIKGKLSSEIVLRCGTILVVEHQMMQDFFNSEQTLKGYTFDGLLQNCTVLKASFFSITNKRSPTHAVEQLRRQRRRFTHNRKNKKSTAASLSTLMGYLDRIDFCHR